MTRSHACSSASRRRRISLLVGIAGADGAPTSRRSVGPGFSISLGGRIRAAPSRISTPGTFSLTVDDRSDEHNFHLSGPGRRRRLDHGRRTSGRRRSPLTLVDGTYTFFCDAHPTRMKGSFTVGTAASRARRRLRRPPSRPRSSSSPSRRKARRRLRRSAGKPRQVRCNPGPVVITVRDRSATRGVRLSGAGVSRIDAASVSSAR